MTDYIADEEDDEDYIMQLGASDAGFIVRADGEIEFILSDTPESDVAPANDQIVLAIIYKLNNEPEWIINLCNELADKLSPEVMH